MVRQLRSYRTEVLEGWRLEPFDEFENPDRKLKNSRAPRANHHLQHDDAKLLYGMSLSIQLAPSETYTPPLVVERGRKAGTEVETGARPDHELRRVYIQCGLNAEAAGSAYLELGNTKVLCAVFGPRQVSSGLTLLRGAEGSSGAAVSSSPSGGSGGGGEGGVAGAAGASSGRLACDLKYAPFAKAKTPPLARTNGGSFVKTRGARMEELNATMGSERRLSQALQHALMPSVRFQEFPNASVEVFALVLESEGTDGDIAAAITCASIALAHAGIPLYDLVAACAVMSVPTTAAGGEAAAATKGRRMIVDPTAAEWEVAMADSTASSAVAEGSGGSDAVSSGDGGGGFGGVDGGGAVSVGGRIQCSILVTMALMPLRRRVTHMESSGRASGEVVASSAELCLQGCAQVGRLMRAALAAAAVENENSRT